MRKWNADRIKRSACKHPYCTDCATRRGSKIGTRRTRHFIKQVLRAVEDRWE